jgi:hypothetical protein
MARSRCCREAPGKHHRLVSACLRDSIDREHGSLNWSVRSGMFCSPLHFHTQHLALHDRKHEIRWIEMRLPATFRP